MALTDDSIKAIVANYPLLESLNVAGCEALTNKSIKAIADCCPALESLNVEGFPTVTYESIVAIAANCPALVSLDIKGCRHESMRAAATRFLVPETLRKEWTEHRNDILSEDGTRIDFGASWNEDKRRWTYKCFTEEQLAEVTDTFVVSLVSLLSPKVTAINLAGCRNVSDVAIRAISAICRALEELNVEDCEALTDESIMAIGENCPALVSLNVLNCG
ncbi:MAG: hypothetical protein AAFV01_17410, partial [Bacteroidota bacterium]